MELVSVIIPTFNRAYCIARAIESALVQSYRNIEVIVVDDGSSDGTESLIRTRYGNNARVRYIWQENRGVSAARNIGLKEVRGEYIALLDSDDVWLPWKIELQLSCMKKNPEVGMVWSDMEAIDVDGKVFDSRYLRTMYSCWRNYPDPLQIFSKVQPLSAIAPNLKRHVGESSFYSGYIFSHMIRGSLVHTSTVLLRRERLDEVGGFNELYRPAGEDFDFHLRTCHVGPVGFLDVVTIQYQRGMDDQLAQRKNAVYVAANFLSTIKPYIKHSRNEIRLPHSVLRSILAEAYQWVGEERFWRNEMHEARFNLAASICYRPFQLRAWKLLLASLIPFRWIPARRSKAQPI